MSLAAGLILSSPPHSPSPRAKREVGIDVSTAEDGGSGQLGYHCHPSPVCCHGNTTPVVLTLTGIEPPVMMAICLLGFLLRKAWLL